MAIEKSMLERGIVSDYNVTDGTYTVDVSGDAVTGCRDMLGPAGSFLGLRIHNRLPVGTLVLIHRGSPSWITNAGAMETADPQTCHSRTMTGCGLPDIVQGISGASVDEPYDASIAEDFYEGESEIVRMNGLFMRFLIGMIGLGASDRAKIEMLLHRELVRMVSRTFEHFSSFGDCKIYEDGRNNVEITGTSYEHERMGVVSDTDERMADPENPPVFDPLATGRWRFKLLLGFLGDMVNTWCHDPQSAAGQMLDDPSQYCAGKFRAHVGHDGTFLLQSVGDIVLERVVRIPVPYRLKHEEDPQGVLREEMETLDSQMTKVWNWAANGKPHHVLFKLRDYCRYLSQFQSCARINQMAQKGEWKVMSESDSPVPTMQEKDRSTPQLYTTRYATIRIMRDGSIITLDHYGNVTATGPYGIMHSSAADYQITAARDIVIKAGRNMYISARRHMEILASVGSLVIKARTGLRALCERGMLWLKSDYNPGTPYTPAEGDPAAEVPDNQAIRIESSCGKMFVQSYKSLRLQCGESTQEGDDFEIFTPNSFQARVQRPSTFKSLGGLQVECGGRIQMLASAVWGKIPGGLHFENIAQMQIGRSEFKNLLVTSVTSTGSMQCLNGTVGNYDHDPSIPVVKPLPEDIERVLPLDPPQGAFSWSLLKQSDYVVMDELFESMTQQQLRLAELQGLSHFEDKVFQTWTGMADALLPARRTNANSTGWPGKDARWWIYETPEYDKLRAPSSMPGNMFLPVDKPLTLQVPQFKYLNT